MKNILNNYFFIVPIIIGAIFGLNINDALARPSETPVTDIQVDGSHSDSIVENSIIGTSVGLITSNGSTAVTYSLACAVAGVDDSHFQIAINQLETTTAFDYENPVDANTDNNYEICIRSTDSETPTFDQTITITVDNVSDSITPEKKTSKKSGSRRISRAQVEKIFGTVNNTVSTEVHERQMKLISLLNQLLALLKNR